MKAHDGLTKRDALKVAEQDCDHASWWALNKAVGCIHPDHGPWPVIEADHHSGLRLVGGKPTVYRPIGEAA